MGGRGGKGTVIDSCVDQSHHSQMMELFSKAK